LAHAGLEPKPAPSPDDPDELQAATSIQCIRQQPVAPGLEVPDFTCARFNIAANIPNMFTDELFTDARVVVEGRVWHVHRAMLASASPILKDAFLCGEHMPSTTFCHMHKCVFPWQLQKILISGIL